MTKMRIELVKSKLRQLRDSIHYIKEFLPSDVSLLEKRKERNALYKETESAIQIMIDICAIINSDIGTTTPSDEDSIIQSLEKEKILSSILAKKIILMKGFRNILVHRYGDVNNQLAFESITIGLVDFNTFIKEIELFLEKQKA